VCGRSFPRPRTESSPGSRGPTGPAGAVRCIASRSAGPTPHTGRPGGASPPRPPPPPARTGARPARPPHEPSRWSVGRGGRRTSRLGLLAYRTVDGGRGDQGPTAAAVLRVRRRSDRPDGPGHRTGGDHVGTGRGGRRDDPRGKHGGRSDVPWRWRGRLGRAGRRPGNRGRRGPGLGEGVAALRAEERAVRTNLPAMKADRHVRRNVNSLKSRRVAW